MMLLSGLLLVLLFSCCMCIGSGYTVESCFDPDVSGTVAWTGSGGVPLVAKGVSGKSCWVVEGTDPKIGQEFIATLPLGKSQGPVRVFFEYVNSSPRRISVAPVQGDASSSSSSSIMLLDGQAGVWADAFVGVADGEKQVLVSAHLKRSQSVCIGRTIVVRTPASSPRPPTADDLRNATCSELSPPQQTRPGPAVTCITQPGRQPSSSTRPSSCVACPECACVCNCNCGQQQC